jgi:hypothetical protein
VVRGVFCNMHGDEAGAAANDPGWFFVGE